MTNTTMGVYNKDLIKANVLTRAELKAYSKPVNDRNGWARLHTIQGKILDAIDVGLVSRVGEDDVKGCKSTAIKIAYANDDIMDTRI